MRAVEKLLTSKRLLSHLSRDFAPVAMHQTFCAEDIVLAHLIFSDLVHDEFKNIRMFAIDTGRTSDEVYYAVEKMQKAYGNVLSVYHADASELEQLGSHLGFGMDYRAQSEMVRHTKPLSRALQKHQAWISTAETLQNNRRSRAWISWDTEHLLPRFNPLARWSREEILNYAKHHRLYIPEDQHNRRFSSVNTPESLNDDSQVSPLVQPVVSAVGQ